MPFQNKKKFKYSMYCRWFQTAISELPWWHFTICLCLKHSSLNSACIVPFSCYNLLRIGNHPKNAILYTYFTLRFSSKQRWKVKLCTAQCAHACFTSHCHVSGQKPQLPSQQFSMNLLHSCTQLLQSLTQPFFHRLLLNLWGFCMTKIIKIGSAILEKFA